MSPPDVKRRGASVDEFLKGSELGQTVSAAHPSSHHGLPLGGVQVPGS